MPENRLAYVNVLVCFLEDLIKDGKGLGCISENRLPSDATIVDLKIDPWKPSLVRVLVRSAEFPPVGEGELPPELPSPLITRCCRCGHG